ncbi:NAD-dependent epimerase/dehydratase family protein [Niabella ginsengisoli]|uniref:NAD-dependent epimerase/dehydratase family protein n=1 Tax=Niabella ginsengisoli TaxID=522298 RepID=A0ABS9SMR7_9BACT|nr:NAD-dependent epimerase/dehydratase family protein [Niabella ginsengisoli]MCH5599576.1 NAD-dependent epimerase/dehydratase family protein [Niabella ginsengisoli]
MTVFVTGVSGLLGTNLVLLLLQKGYTVKGLVRSKSSYKHISHDRLQIIEAELNTDLSVYLQNVDIVIHVAAVTRQDLISYKDYQINYNATENILCAAVKAKVKKFIYVSTANTIGYGIVSNNEVPEYKTMLWPFTRSLYARSKAAAEAHVLSKQGDITVHIVNPTFMIGPNDSKPSSGKIILMAMKNGILFYPPGGKNFVAVKDVAIGIEKCIQVGKNGHRYLLAGINMSYEDFFRLVKMFTKRRQVLFPIPSLLLLVAGLIGDILRSFKIKTSLCTNNMQILRVKNYYDNKTSIAELGIQYQSIEKAVAESVEYFRQECK